MKSFLIVISLISLPAAFSIFSAGTQYGQESQVSNVRESSMGHTGTGICDSLSFSAKNPATLGGIKRTLFLFSYEQEYTRLQDQDQDRYINYKQGIPQINMAFSLGWFGNVSASFVNRLYFDYNFTRTYADASSDTQKTTGSLYSLDLSYARSINSFLDLGLSYNIYSGKDSVRLIRTNADFYSTKYIQSEEWDISKHIFTVGFLLKHKNLNFGASWQNGDTLNIIQQEEIKAIRNGNTAAYKLNQKPI
ncbi:MAG: hypothetical protein ABIA63_12710, partial [bacterium]